MSEPYATLGLARGATDKDIRNAFRKMAKQFHPDHNPGDKKAEESFKAVNAAYAILGDKEKRARYDRGEIDAQGNERAPFGAAGGFSQAHASRGFGGASGQFSQEDLSAFFSNVFQGEGFAPGFGGASSRPRQQRGANLNYSIDISFEDSVIGAVRRLTFPETGTVEVRIPPGIEQGQTLRLSGKGAPGLGARAPAGDALITVKIMDSPRYTRSGRDLRAEEMVDIRTAVLGGKLRIPTPKGDVTMTIPPHSDTGKVLRLGGRGVAAHNGQPAGDLYVTLLVRIGGMATEIGELLKKGAHEDAAKS